MPRLCMSATSTASSSVEKFKAKRAELKAILANPKTTDVEFFTAQRKLAKLRAIRRRCASGTAAP